jgi:HEPN domain-containing protein/predicted nucleotidyltransferase
MVRKVSAPVAYVQPYRYPSPNIPLSAIRRFARQIAERFHPEEIILFGSYAYGQPHAESDVDLLVIMPSRDAIDQSIRIDLAFEWPFSHDLIVRTPQQIERGLRQDNWFLREVMEKGKVLYQDGNTRRCTDWKSVQHDSRPCRGNMKPETAQWVQFAEEDLQGARDMAAKTPPLRNLACFHCQQAAEKYLKAFLQELGDPVPRTHELEPLLGLLLPHDATLANLRRVLKSLNRYAVGFRYPGHRAKTKQMEAALRHAERVRVELRSRLGLPP